MSACDKSVGPPSFLPVSHNDLTRYFGEFWTKAGLTQTVGRASILSKQGLRDWIGETC